MRKVWINGRFLTQPITGVQRYSIEIVRAMDRLIGSIQPPCEFELVIPRSSVQKSVLNLENIKISRHGLFTGHIWEQVSLPLSFAPFPENDLLINLANIGPVIIGRQILVIHDVSYFKNPNWFSKSFSLLYRNVVPLVAKRCRKIITDSSFSKKEISHFINLPLDNIAVIHPSVFFCDRHDSGSIGQNEYGKYILAVSSIDPRKNLKRLVHAFKKCGADGLCLVIVGTKNKVFSDPDIKSLTENDPRIIFTGYVPDSELRNLYLHALMFAYPSLYEGFGLPPLEAMACGCPVLTSNVSSLPEVCGDAAYYVDPYNVDSISAGLSSLIEDHALRTALVKKGYENIKRFNWDAAAKEMLKVIITELK